MVDVLTERGATESASAPLLRAVGITKTYRTPDHLGRLVLEQLDFTLRDGEIVTMLGKSGAGKSTFLRILAGLIAPSEGRVEYRGQPVNLKPYINTTNGVARVLLADGDGASGGQSNR